MNHDTTNDGNESGTGPGETSTGPWLLRAARRAGVDRAVAFAILTRVWQLLTGPVTQFLIVVNFSRSTQDYYYAFGSLLGMQIFVELGLHVVIISVSSHEWAGLSFVNGRITGNPVARSRLISLGRLMLKWYGATALLFAILMTMAGWAFFTNTTAHSASLSALENRPAREMISWTAPWIALVLVNAMQLTILPLTAILEGCHQLSIMNRVRFWQGVAGTIFVWCAVCAGAGLWALVVSAIVRLAGDLYLIAVPFREFFRAFRSQPEHDSVDWKREILPLQWRIAIQGVVLWLAGQLPLLMVFRHLPEGDATRLGMTWTILTAVQAAAFAWVETRRPVFGSLIAAKRYKELDALFFRQVRVSTGVLIAGSLCFTLFIYGINRRNEWLFVRLSERLLPVTETALLSAGFIAYLPAMCASIYVRAHKRDPFLIASTVSNLTVAACQLIPGWIYGVSGIVTGYFAAVTLLQTPWLLAIWWKFRREWHLSGEELQSTHQMSDVGHHDHAGS